METDGLTANCCYCSMYHFHPQAYKQPNSQTLLFSMSLAVCQGWVQKLGKGFMLSHNWV
jgi:hypothetical protein